MKTKIIRVSNYYEDNIEEACNILKNGGLVAFPTETVYGLGALVSIPEAIRRIFLVKGRPFDNPLIVHVGSIEQMQMICYIEEKYFEIIKKITPGPITFVLRKKESVPVEITAGLDTVGVRFPSHPIAQRLALCAGAIAAPSANLSGKPSPTNFESVWEDLNGKIECIIDGGESVFGIESTIIDLTKDMPIILRPGPITVEELREIFGKVEVYQTKEDERPLAPGMKYKHYAPEKKLKLIDKDLLINYANKDVLILCTKETKERYLSEANNTYIIGSYAQPYTIAQNLYKSFRYIDKSPYQSAVIERLPEYGIFFSIMNRIKKASQGE
ncbi:MAG: L-threonylcarbamoyladenylate synthase [bacterium]|nr:L-threonylcarbamoyladenylate synthase [bacterium]